MLFTNRFFSLVCLAFLVLGATNHCLVIGLIWLRVVFGYLLWVNCFFIRDLRTPFGGVGDSGVGREGGNFSREFFTEPKAVVMQIDREVPGAS